MRKGEIGFTLIEVLLALAVISIALTALVKASIQNTTTTQRLTEKMISHWVAKQGVTMIQLGLLSINSGQEVTQVTTMLGQRWYWRARVNQTAIKSVQQLSIKVSKNQNGPFNPSLVAFLYH